MVEFECTYCGDKWNAFPRNHIEVEAEICKKCGDSTLKVRDALKSKIDYYKGSEPFKSKYDDSGSNN